MKPALPYQVLRKPALLLFAGLLVVVAWQAGRDAPRSVRTNTRDFGTSSDRADRTIPVLEQVLRIPDVELRHRQEAILAASVPIHAIPALLEQLSDSRRTSLYAAVLAGRWASEDPAGAAAWISRQRGTKSQAGLLAAIAGSWADEDGVSALAWARGIEETGARENALVEISRVIARRDPHTALDLAGELGRSDLAPDCLRDWAQRDPSEAARWTRSIPAAADRTAAMVEVAAEWASRDAAAATGFVVDAMADEDRMDQVIVAVISHAGASDLPMLRDWIDSFPPGALKETTRAELTRIERLLPSAPANLPGEDAEDRSPVAVSGR